MLETAAALSDLIGRGGGPSRKASSKRIRWLSG
jgi:hypothetical protein